MARLQPTAMAIREARLNSESSRYYLVIAVMIPWYLGRHEPQWFWVLFEIRGDP